MLIGVMSDSHDNLTNIKKAIRVFNDCSVSHVLHAGDFTSVTSFNALNDLKADFCGIFGNNDHGLLNMDKVTKGKIFTQPYEFIIEQKRFVMIHEHFLVDQLAQNAAFDFLIYGHTHRPHVGQIDHTIVLNPGETCGSRHNRSTVALLDITKGEAHFINLE
ncbi:MAG: metallophosphoesterase [Nitrospirae bacterium]|nr:metallophosphoesterase [Nitrospirota bacterium]